MSRGFCGIGVIHSRSKENLGTLWRSAHAFGVDWLFTVARRYHQQPTDTTKAHRSVPLWHFATLMELLCALPLGCELVAVEIDVRAKELPQFVHPEQACYLLGAEDRGVPEEVLASCRRIVQIPGAQRCLNVATAGSIVLYDRISKQKGGANA